MNFDSGWEQINYNFAYLFFLAGILLWYNLSVKPPSFSNALACA